MARVWREFARELADCGVRRVNVSLDTLDPDRFRAVTRTGDLARVLRGIEAAREAGLKVKLNAVALRGVNEDEVIELTRFAHDRGMDMTFIEVMPLGELEGQSRVDQYLPLDRGARAPRGALHAGGHRLPQRRPGALYAGEGDRRPRRLHHSA